MDTKLCAVCGADLPLLRRSDRRYCGGRCRVRAYRVRADASRRRPRKAEESSATQAAVVGVAAAGASLTALRWQLTLEGAHRRTLEMEVKRAEATLANVRKERDAAVEEARQAREGAQALHLNLKHEQEQRERVQAKAEQLQEDLRCTKKSLHDALVKGDEFYGNWHAAQTALDDERNHRAYEGQGDTGHGLDPVHTRVAYLEQRVQDLEAQFAGFELERATVEGDSQRAAQLTARVATLEKQLEVSREKETHLTKKLTRRKNASKQLDAGEEEASSGSLVGRVSAALVGVAAGAATAMLTGRSAQKVLPSASPKGYLPGRSKP